MSDRPVRDRTLILRILVPGLETRLRDKMKEMEEGYASSSKQPNVPHSADQSSSTTNKETLLDLDGVNCEPTNEASTLWNFHCDGATYPARLVNLPCPVELHKTHDHAMFYKCCDVAQMLIVYEDSMALDEGDNYPKTEGYPSYYHSGLTYPLKRVVERRFGSREHVAVAPPRAEVFDDEGELYELMCKISKEMQKGSGKRKVPSLASAQHANKVLEEVEEEVVDYEPYMDDFGRQPAGVELDADDQLLSRYPEVWLEPGVIKEIKLIEKEKEEEAKKKKQAAAAKKEKKKKKQKEAELPPAPSKKKGIASKNNAAAVDEVAQAAATMMQTGDFDLENDDFLNDLNFDGEEGFDLNPEEFDM
jgi:transcription initiation factor TFIID subunit 7